MMEWTEFHVFVTMVYTKPGTHLATMSWDIVWHNIFIVYLILNGRPGHATFVSQQFQTGKNVAGHH